MLKLASLLSYRLCGLLAATAIAQAFEKPDFCDTAHSGVRVIDERLQRFAKRMKPLTVVNHFSIFQGDLLLKMQGIALNADLFDRFVRFIENRAAGCFINAARFHPHQAVFNQYGDAHTMLATKFIEFGDDLVHSIVF